MSLYIIEPEVADRIKKKIENKGIMKSHVVSIEKTREFERKNNISLPAELVFFYTEISNGCKMIDDFDLLPIEKVATVIPLALDGGLK